jgi:DEAD/DEAH box helicase domain-containing protein
LQAALETWRVGNTLPALSHAAEGDWVYNDKAGLTQDLVTCMPVAGGPGIGQVQAVILARLGDFETTVTAGDFRERWRRFLACMNLYQFCDRLTMWTTSEAQDGTAPNLPMIASVKLDSAWASVFDQTTSSVRPNIAALSAAGIPVPQVEYYLNQFDGDAFAEMAWPDLSQPIAILVGDQATFAGQWQEHGWMVVPLEDIQAKGITWFIEMVISNMVGASRWPR